MKKIFFIIYNNKSKKEEEHKMEDMNDRRRYVNEILGITIIEIKERDNISESQYLDLEEDINFITSIEED